MLAVSARESSCSSEHFDKDPAIIYVLDHDLRIVYCNEAWDRFAVENGGGLLRPRALGLSVIDLTPAPLKEFFEKGYRNALSTGRVWQHCYDCSSPELFREYQMRVYPNRETAQLVVVHSLIVETPRSITGPEICTPDEKLYADQNGIVTICCECRRTCRRGQSSLWDWVPAYIERLPERISHGLCDACLNIYDLNCL
jgi:hypothetical protein